MTTQILKYPRTRHIEGSRLQPGDEDLHSVQLAELAKQPLVIEEKLDGANAGISFVGGELRLQSRGHYLTGGHRERHFHLFKTWANTHRNALWDRLGDRLIVYGEWLYAKHTVFYDQLPHYFLEFDVFDRETGSFYDTPRRHELFADSPISSVPVLWSGSDPTRAQLQAMIAPSLYKSQEWRAQLEESAVRRGVDPARALAETDPSELMEGLYIKLERGGCVDDRFKFVRASFLTTVVDSGSHWLDRPIIPNQLSAETDIYAS